MAEHGFSLDLELTEAVVLTKKGVPRFLAIQVDKIMVLPQLALKCLAIMIDIKMSRFTKLISRHGYFQFYLHTIGK